MAAWAEDGLGAGEARDLVLSFGGIDAVVSEVLHDGLFGDADFISDGLEGEELVDEEVYGLGVVMMEWVHG